MKQKRSWRRERAGQTEEEKRDRSPTWKRGREQVTEDPARIDGEHSGFERGQLKVKEELGGGMGFDGKIDNDVLR